MTLLNYTVMPAFEEVVDFEIGAKQVAYSVIPPLLHLFLLQLFKLVKLFAANVAIYVLPSSS